MSDKPVYPTICLRTDPVGGQVKDNPEFQRLKEVAGFSRFVLLIHGYNNNKEQADKAYDGFRRTQWSLKTGLPRKNAAAEDLHFTVDGAKVVDVFWPGDADWGFLSFLAYPFRLRVAKESAKKIKDLLLSQQGLASLERIDIIAHSLGCRVAVELMRELENAQGRVRVGQAVLMAAAVPADKRFKQGDVFRISMEHPWLGVKSLYSGSDMVLTFAFPPGQTAAGDGFFPTALGHEKLIRRDYLPLRLQQEEVAGAGHSDYWGHSDAMQQGRFANLQARQFLQPSFVAVREQQKRETAEKSVFIKNREIKNRIPGEPFPMGSNTFDQDSGWYG